MPNDDPATTSQRLTNLAHLSSAVGHHVINAYSAIVSNAEILQLTTRAGMPTDPAGVADLIIRTAVEASGVARRLIDYTRPVTTTGERTVALDRLIAEVIEARKSDGASSINWAAQPGPVPTIRGNADQLKSMIGHLLTNAEEAMIGSGGTVTLSTSMDERKWIVLEIRDTGPGMTPDVQEKAVEPFFTTKPAHMGVGLSIANGIWRRHRGTLAIRTGIDQGTQVRLCVDPIEGGLSGR